MALLSNGKLNRLASEFMSAKSATGFENEAVSKSQNKTLHVDIDIWVDANIGDLASSISEPTATDALLTEKSAALVGVVIARYAADNPETMDLIASYVTKLAGIQDD